MTAKKRKHLGLWLALLCLLAVGLLFVTDGLDAVLRLAYPQKYGAYVGYYAQKYGLDENQVYAVIRTESGFDPQAESSVGARGLMQITEETFAWIKSKIAPAEPVTFDDLYDPEVNVRFGTYLLKVCLDRYGGDLSTAAAAYHSGIGRVDALLADPAYSADGKTLHTFPYAQMNHYVGKVNGNYKKYAALYGAQEKERESS